MDCAFIVTWSAPYPGREAAALDFAADSDAYWSSIAADGRCTPPEWFFHPAGWGMWMVKGERAVLTELVHGEQSRRLLARGQLLVRSWEYALAETGAGAERYMADYGAQAAEIGLL